MYCSCQRRKCFISLWHLQISRTYPILFELVEKFYLTSIQSCYHTFIYYKRARVGKNRFGRSAGAATPRTQKRLLHISQSTTPRCRPRATSIVRPLIVSQAGQKAAAAHIVVGQQRRKKRGGGSRVVSLWGGGGHVTAGVEGKPEARRHNTWLEAGMWRYCTADPANPPQTSPSLLIRLPQRCEECRFLSFSNTTLALSVYVWEREREREPERERED
jgi:hypothetical protein